MIDIKAFVLNLPSFIERSYFISPGIVSVVFKIIWSIFIFLVVTFMIQYGLAAIGLRRSQTENRQKSLWNSHCEFTQVQSVSNGRWGDMFFNLPSIRVILGLLFWTSIYACELLFSLSIDNAYINHYNGTNCIGRIDDYKTMTNSMWDADLMFVESDLLLRNSTLLRQLVNQRQVGNFALLGDGIFTISPPNALYSKGQTIKASRAGMNCTTTIQLKRTDRGFVYRSTEESSMFLGNVSTEHFFNIPLSSISTEVYAYINLALSKTNFTRVNSGTNFEQNFLIVVANPLGLRENDINVKVYNNSVFLNDCTLFYEQGYVTINKEGYLNETNVADTFSSVFNQTLYDEFTNGSLTRFLNVTDTFLSFYEFPDSFLNAKYNETYGNTLKSVNDIVAAHFINGLDPYADPCTFNQEQVPVYISVIGTKMSFGYIIIGVAFAIFSILILFALSFAMFTQEERKQWALYSYDWCFTGYVSKGEIMGQKEFKKYAKDTFTNDNDDDDSKEVLEVAEDVMFRSDTPLRKE